MKSDLRSLVARILPLALLLVVLAMPGSAPGQANNGAPVDALIYTTLSSTRDHRPEMAMDGDPATYFRSRGGMDDGDDFVILLSRPIPVRSISITTGDPDGNDLFTDGFVETSPDERRYTKAASFDAKGTADFEFRNRSVMAIRIRTNARRSSSHLVIREIAIRSNPPIDHVQMGPGRGFIDLGDNPDLADWAARAEKAMESFWADTDAILYSYGFIPPNMVNVVYKTGPRVTGVAATGGGVMTVNTKWCRAHADDIGLTVHETAHVVQSINVSAPGWLIEGTADYIRWVKYEPQHFHPRINVNRATYHDAYQTTATFLGWVANHYDSAIVTKLNDAARSGTYKNSLFEKYCGKDVNALWTEFIAAYKADPATILASPSAPGMTPRTTPSVQPGTSLTVDLSSLFDIGGITSDGTRVRNTAGFDGEGSTYPAVALSGMKTLGRIGFQFGPANAMDAVACRGNVIALPAGNHHSIWLLAAAVEGSHHDLPITITYSDGSTKGYSQNFSDWYVPEEFPGETRALSTDHRNTADGSKDNRSFNVYRYGFELDPGKSVKSVTLPNDDGVRVFAISMAN